MTWENTLWIVGLAVVWFGLSLLLIAFLLIQLPSTFFLDSHSRELWLGRHRVIRWSGLVLKNLLGACLILMGGFLCLPGIPGQGLLTVLIGLILVDFPGKRRVERAFLRRPRIGGAVNRLRRRFGKPPFLF